MEHHAGIDVSLELSSVCVVDGRGKIVREAKVASEPDALVSFFKGLGLPVKLIGLEAGPLSQWLHAGLMRAGFEAVLLETRHVKAALSAATVKTDRKDARGLAQLIRMGWFRPVHAKFRRFRPSAHLCLVQERKRIADGAPAASAAAAAVKSGRRVSRRTPAGPRRTVPPLSSRKGQRLGCSSRASRWPWTASQLSRGRRQAIFLGATEPRAARPGRSPPRCRSAK